MSARWGHDSRPPSLAESSGHGGTLALVCMILAILACLAATL